MKYQVQIVKSDTDAIEWQSEPMDERRAVQPLYPPSRPMGR